MDDTAALDSPSLQYPFLGIDDITDMVGITGNFMFWREDEEPETEGSRHTAGGGDASGPGRDAIAGSLRAAMPCLPRGVREALSAKERSTRVARWRGYYIQQGDRYVMTFRRFSLRRDDSNSTWILEGIGEDEVGRFSISGRSALGAQQDGSCSLRLVKHYFGQHSIEYVGKMSEDGNLIQGKWDLGHWNLAGLTVPAILTAFVV